MQSVLAAIHVRLRTTSNVVVTPDNLALSIGLGIVVTALAGLLPAIGASRVPVLVALRAATTEPTGAARSRRGPIVGGVLLLLGLAGAGVGQHQRLGQPGRAAVPGRAGRAGAVRAAPDSPAWSSRSCAGCSPARAALAEGTCSASRAALRSRCRP